MYDNDLTDSPELRELRGCLPRRDVRTAAG
jgi:hypothetical protein